MQRDCYTPDSSSCVDAKAGKREQQVDEKVKHCKQESDAGGATSFRHCGLTPTQRQQNESSVHRAIVLMSTS